MNQSPTVKSGTAEFYNGEQLDVQKKSAHIESASTYFKKPKDDKQREIDLKTIEAIAAASQYDLDPTTNDYVVKGIEELEQYANDPYAEQELSKINRIGETTRYITQFRRIMVDSSLSR